MVKHKKYERSGTNLKVERASSNNLVNPREILYNIMGIRKSERRNKKKDEEVDLAEN